MAKPRSGAQTPATRWLEQHHIAYTAHTYPYQEHGGARHAAACLNVELNRVVKTLVMEDENSHPLLVIMHGDQEVSTKKLARQTGAKRITPCRPHIAERHSGYLVGGTSPFGTRKKMPVWVQTSILEHEQIYINGGRRGFLVCIASGTLIKPLGATPIDAEL